MALADIYRSPISGLSFSRSQIHRPLTEHDDPEKLPRALCEASTRVLLLSEAGAAVTGGQLLFLDGPAYVPQADDRQVFLGSHGAQSFVLAIVSSEHYPQIAPEQWISLREAFTVLGGIEAELFVEAQAIANWIRTEKFCPRCGSETRSATFGWGQRCVANGHELFPRTDPAVIAAIIDAEDRILLGANATFRTHMYSVLAGFVEAGESLESAVRREIFEESGVHVGDVAYRGSQPWPLPRSLMLGFTGEALSTELVPDGAEIQDLRWFTREQLGAELRAGSLQIPRGASIAHALIKSWYGEDLPEASK